MLKKKHFTIGWAVIIGAGVIWEGLALVNSLAGDTLSEHVWLFQEPGFARTILVGGFFLWLFIHMTWKGRHG